MANMYGIIGQSMPEHLLHDPMNGHPIAVPMEPGNGTVPRGAVVYRKASGFWAPAASDQITTGYMLAVLNEEIDTGNGSVAENAAAYQTGRFIDGKVKYNNSGVYTAVTAAHKVAMAKQGMFVGQSMESAGEFDNGSYTITYKANNAANPAEDDVTDTKMAGESYTILNNSAEKLGFTAPDSKSFSKWNTKADGNGTDYAAAASYTTDADLTLYAVWA